MSNRVFEKINSKTQMLPDLDDSSQETISIDDINSGTDEKRSYSPMFNKKAIVRGMFEKKLAISGSETKSNLILTGVILVFTFSLIGVVIMWCTDVFNSTLLSSLIIANETLSFNWFKQPPVKMLLKIHIFNYTNVDRWNQRLDDKLIVKDIGPYTYAETKERINEMFNPNGTLTYQERREYHFIPEKSTGKQYDQLVVPNFPLLSATSMARESYFMTQYALNTVFKSLNAGPFKTLPAHKFMWGYEDSLVTLAKPILSIKERLPFEHFGLLATRNGTQRDKITIFTGETDMSKLGLISKFNGESEISYWGTKECNRVDGTDGSLFPPSMVDKNQTLYIYNKDLCRRFPLIFKEEVSILEGIPAWRYHAPPNVFSHPDENPANQCFCHMDTGLCPPQGVFNASPCAYGAPAYASFPHFYLGDPKLRSAFEGLNPDPVKHDTYVDLHPRLGFPLAGVSRFQINIQIRKAEEIKGFDRFEDLMYLPVAWIEMTVDEEDLTQDIRSLIYHSSFSANALQMTLRYGSLLTFVTSFTLLVTMLYLRRTRNYTNRTIKIKKNHVTST